MRPLLVAVAALLIAATTAACAAPPAPATCTTTQADQTSHVQSLINSAPNGSTVSFTAGACYRIEGTVNLNNRNLTLNGNGATFQSLSAPEWNQAMFRAADSTVTWRNMSLTGQYASGGTHNEALQHIHAIELLGADGVVENVQMRNWPGDCVMFGLSLTDPSNTGRSSGAVRDSECHSIGRNAVSVVAGNDIRVERVTTSKVGFVTFDVEPNPGSGNGSCRVTVDNNTIGTYFLYAWAIPFGHAPTCDQTFTNNRVVGQGLRVAVLNPTHRPQRVNVSGNSSSTATNTPAMDITGVDGLTITNNTVPMLSGRMAKICSSAGVVFSRNLAPGGTIGGTC
jgi:hypothetical protein